VEKMLRNVKVIEQTEDQDNSQVRLGSKVRIKDLEYDEDIEYAIVGSAEADPMNSRISYESPVGDAIMGKCVGDVVHVNAPAGEIRYKILEVK
jgi:transcription elongation factor GreA